MEPASDPNIEKIELVDGPTVEFNRALGWYNSENGTIEGITVYGIRDTIPIVRVVRAEIKESSGTETGLLVICSFLVAAVVVLIFALIRVGNTSGL